MSSNQIKIYVLPMAFTEGFGVSGTPAALTDMR